MNDDAGIDVLIPTCGRPAALAVTLMALAAQSFAPMRIIISDQSAEAFNVTCPELAAVLRYLAHQQRDVLYLRHLPRRGMAEQRSFLLAQASAPWCLYLDDDVITESDLLVRLHRAITSVRCGFVGSALHGLSFINDVRPEQQQIQLWEEAVVPETIRPDSQEWARHHLHSAANLLHVQSQLQLPAGTSRLYRVAWVGGCVLFDTQKLRAAGGFDFWPALPCPHCGEDVWAQLRVMEKFGGCAIIPSGAYHMECATTLPRRDTDAARYFYLAEDHEDREDRSP